MVDSISNNIQAFPARETRIGKITSEYATLPDGSTVDLQRCVQQIVSSIQTTLINFVPVRFLLVDPPKEIPLVIDLHLYEIRSWNAGTKVHVEFKLRFIAKSQGIHLEYIEQAASSSDFNLPAYPDPCNLAVALGPLMEGAVEEFAIKVTQSETVNRGVPWHSVVKYIADGIIYIDGGRMSGLEVDNLLDVFRSEPDDPTVFKRISTVQIQSVDLDTCACKYYEHTHPTITIGDRVYVKFLNGSQD